jgi:hypothetical protein
MSPRTFPGPWHVETAEDGNFIAGKPNPLFELVGVSGFEPPTPCSRSRCATRLRYTPA